MDDLDDNMPTVPAGSDDTGTVATEVSPKQEALRGLPPEWREQLIEQAAAMGIHAEADVAWLLVKSFINAWAGAAAATVAAERIESAAKGVGDLIFNQTVRAGNDLKALVAAGVEEKTVEAGSAVVAVINHATQAGAAALKAAAMAIPEAANAQRDSILAEWRQHLASAAAQEAAGRARRSEWWLGGIGLAMMVAGAGLGGWVGRATAPKTWPAGAPPAAMWRYPQQNMNEYAWPASDARLTRSCPPGDLCLLLRRR